MQQLRENFDANGDGELDPAERRALREHLHQQRGGVTPEPDREGRVVHEENQIGCPTVGPHA